MFNSLFGMGDLADLSLLSALIVVIVEVIKQFIPKKVPTQIVTLIIGIALSLFLILPNFEITFITIIKSILIGFLAAFVSMNGFDSLNNIWLKFTQNNTTVGDDNELH